MGNQAAKRNLRVEAAREKPNLSKAKAKMTRRNKDRQRNQSEDVGKPQAWTKPRNPSQGPHDWSLTLASSGTARFGLSGGDSKQLAAEGLMAQGVQGLVP